jgi:prophage regulatory protein
MTTKNHHPSSWAMTVKEACTALNMARSKLYYLCDPKSPYFDPAFPRPIRIGKGSVRLDRAALEHWYAQQQARTSTSSLGATRHSSGAPP